MCMCVCVCVCVCGGGDVKDTGRSNWLYLGGRWRDGRGKGPEGNMAAVSNFKEKRPPRGTRRDKSNDRPSR